MRTIVDTATRCFAGIWARNGVCGHSSRNLGCVIEFRGFWGRGARPPLLLMSARRYTVVIADRSSGALRRLTVNLRLTVIATAATLALPVLIGLGAKWSARSEIEQLR